MKIILTITTLVLSTLSFAQDGRLWSMLEEVKFESKYSEEANGYFDFPSFTEALEKLDGKEVTVTGHYLPFDFGGTYFIISKYPYASCFFCGGAGPESVIAVFPNSKWRKLVTDEVITIKGKLHLNKDDLEMLSFVIKEAKLVE